MSKLVQAVVALDTNKRYYKTPLFDSTIQIESFTSNPTTYLREYAIKATFGSLCRIDESIESDLKLELAKNNVKRSIIEAVFGEFRQDFRLLEEAIWGRDDEKSMELLHAFEEKMFSEV